MDHLNYGGFFVSSIVAIIFGVFGGVCGLFSLVVISYIIIFVSISSSTSIDRHQMVFLIPLSFLSSFTINIRLIMEFFSIGFENFVEISLAIVTFVSLVSIEELFLGVLGLLLWGEQSAIYYINPLDRWDTLYDRSNCTIGYSPNHKKNKGRYLHKL